MYQSVPTNSVVQEGALSVLFKNKVNYILNPNFTSWAKIGTSIMQRMQICNWCLDMGGTEKGH